MEQIRRTAVDRLRRAGTCGDLQLHFDPAAEGCSTEPADWVQKTVRRTVISLEHGRFEARETVRQQTRHSALLAGTVAAGARYAFDLIAHVGMESYLRGRSLQDLRQELLARTPSLDIPVSSLWDQQQRFLFHLGQLHAQASPLLRQYLADHGPVTWLLDGTIEPGTPVLLGIEEAKHGIFLAGSKIRSENTEEVVACLKQATERYGRPDRVLHDLSPTLSKACDQALEGVSHKVCHYHLARDIGLGLCERPQGELCKRMRTLEVQFRLRKQRNHQTEALLRQGFDSPARLVLGQLLAGCAPPFEFNQNLSREVLLAFHYWILDYRSEGHRRGFPFDPYLLYLHRRLVRAGQAIDNLLSHPHAARNALPVLFNFQSELRRYRNDTQIIAAADSYERSYSMFTKLRKALRLSADDIQNLHQVRDLAPDQQYEIRMALDSFRNGLRQQLQLKDDADRELAEIVLKHLDKYWPYLAPDQIPTGETWHRTTSQLEQSWGSLKRCRRQAHGRARLTRDFMALPEEYALVLNLQNATYVDLVLGGRLEELPSKLAEASRQAGSFSQWRKRHRPQLLGRLPRCLLRAEDFIQNLIDVCDQDRQERKEAA